MIKAVLVGLLFAASVGTGFAAAKKAKPPAASSATSKSKASAQPAWLQTRIADMKEKYKGSDKEISIAKYKFDGKTYYLLPPGAPCCDMPTELVDESGNHYCQLGGGFANHTDRQCENFRETGEQLEVVWSSAKK